MARGRMIAFKLYSVSKAMFQLSIRKFAYLKYPSDVV